MPDAKPLHSADAIIARYCEARSKQASDAV